MPLVTAWNGVSSRSGIGVRFTILFGATMTALTRHSRKQETLEILPCPFCGGAVMVRDCGYSTFNPGTAQCRGTCRREFKLGMVYDQWEAGERWNKLQPFAMDIEAAEMKLLNLRRAAGMQ